MDFKDPDFKHIATAGNIGAGKTTLTALLSRHYGWEPHFEEVENNPYIDDFYQDMQRWSFHMQIYYLNARFRQTIEIRKGEKTIIQDRTIYEDAHIFAPNLYEMGLMNQRDYDTYNSLYNTIQQSIQPPDLIIYLKASIPTLVDQIQKRGRKFEDSIRLDYLRKLNQRYDDWVNSYTASRVLVVDIDECNFEDNAEALGDVINRIERERSGLFLKTT
jgi:deoxyadenosine/deoxycytidine kinase